LALPVKNYRKIRMAWTIGAWMAPVNVNIVLDDDFNGFRFADGYFRCQFGTPDDNESIYFTIEPVIIQRCRYFRQSSSNTYKIRFDAGAGKLFTLEFLRTADDGGNFSYSFVYHGLDDELATGFPIKAAMYNQIAAYIQARLPGAAAPVAPAPAPVAAAPVAPAPVEPAVVAPAANNEPYEPNMPAPGPNGRKQKGRGRSKRRGAKKQRKTRRH
jgi:hypothetical protein